MKKLLLTIFLISSLCLSLGVFAQVELDQEYPTVQDSSGVQRTISGETKLPEFVSYLINWAIILAVLVVIITLIIAGIQYLTAGGKPESMTGARKRIYNSLLGLAILVGSYLILATINPQLTIMSLVIEPLDSGVILLTQEGYEALTLDVALNDILRENKAHIISGDVADLTEVLGPLVEDENHTTNNKVNFADFPLYAIGFWGTDGSFADNVKIRTFNGLDSERTDVKGQNEKPPNIYTMKGRVDINDEDVVLKDFISIGNPVAVNAILFEGDFFESYVSYYPFSLDDYQENLKDEADMSNAFNVDKVIHPPLSIVVQGTGPGVYLYSNEGGQRYLLTNNSDFTMSDIKFNDMADKIEINDYEKDDETGSPSHSYVAILHSYYRYTDNLRIFFNKVDDSVPDRQKPIRASIYEELIEFKVGENLVTLCDEADDTEENYCKDGSLGTQISGVYDSSNMFYKGNAFQPGNIIIEQDKRTAKIEINSSGFYGGLSENDKASSIQIFEAVKPVSQAGDFSWDDFRDGSGREQECREVRLCTDKDGTGHCISYTPGGKVNPDAYNSMTLPMPFFYTVNIPEMLTGVVKTTDKEIKKVNSIKFIDEIESIIIKGNCLVVLFERPMIETESCLGGELTKCWKNGLPGSHSETFTETDWDLTNNQIGQCPSSWGVFLGGRDPCASAITVFPLKTIQ